MERKKGRKEKYSEEQKQQLYALYDYRHDLSVSEIAREVGMPVRTARYFLTIRKQVEQITGLDLSFK